MCTRNAWPKVVEDFASRDPFIMAELSNARYERQTFYLPYCGMTVEVKYPGGMVALSKSGLDEDEAEPAHEEKILILQYLTRACGLPPRGQWVPFQELKAGLFHWDSLQREALQPLSRHYGDKLEQFTARGQRYGGKPLERGDAGIAIPVFPHLSLAFLLWEGDEEFAPRSTVLFDSVAEAYFPTAVLYVMAIQTVIRIWFPGDTRFDAPKQES